MFSFRRVTPENIKKANSKWYDWARYSDPCLFPIIEKLPIADATGNSSVSGTAKLKGWLMGNVDQLNGKSNFESHGICEKPMFPLLLLVLLLVIRQSPYLPRWWKVNLTVTRRPHHPSIAAGLYCLATSPGFLICSLRDSEVGSFTCVGYYSPINGTDGLKVLSERLGNEDKAPCPRALLPGRGSNRRTPVWKTEVLTTWQRQLV